MASSPHTRGSSSDRGRRNGYGRVVPAHAGVIPFPLFCCRRRMSRPRTRGGHPRSYRCSTGQAGSSPHTRGSSPCPGPRCGRWTVVPAHAGVIRSRWTARWWRWCRPRTRGGHPVQRSEELRQVASSPHTRGSSSFDDLGRHPDAVVPAHAGVIPSKMLSGESPHRRPRTRGGHPQAQRGPPHHHRSSPHTRGSSRTSSSGRPGLSRRPRTRGGHPPSTCRPRSWHGSSPHTRGSSLVPLVEVVIVPVVPAHAGVIPGAVGGGRHRPGRPRTRGGHPVAPDQSWSAIGSSPHTRGSSPGRVRGGVQIHVVPAHAGVILRVTNASRSTCRRPRTRAGHPSRRARA